MKKQSIYISSSEETIVKFLNGDLSDSDRISFDKWIHENPANKKTYEEVKKIWDHSGNLNAFQSIDTKNDWLKVKGRLNFKGAGFITKAAVTKRLIWFRRIAAIFIIIISIGFLARQFIFTSPDMIIVSAGENKNEVLLPDGSMVFLNKYSELKYPEKFRHKIRHVDLTGEGYFEVTRNPDKLFQISIDDQAIVEVLGTSFNLKSDKERGSVDVSVISGRVAFYTPEKEYDKTILVKDEQATMQNGSISKEESKDKNFLSWRTGVLIFDNDRIENVLDEIGKFYEKELIFKNTEGKDLRITSRFDNQEFESVLEELSLVLNLDYTIEGERIIFHNRY